MDEASGKIAFQGFHGAFSDLACRAMYPDMATLPCETFADAFASVETGAAELAMIPVDNTLAGRVADVHHLMPRGNLHIVGEYFLPIRHALLALPAAVLGDLTDVHSHVHALPQCRRSIARLGLKPHVHADTAGAAAAVAAGGDPTQAAIASTLAAEIYGLKVLAKDMQDEDHNTTRFLVWSRKPANPDATAAVVTSFLFRVRNIPAALYKALGGFATNGVNITKLESYVDENFQAARFFCDVEGHPDQEPLRLALEELGFFAAEMRMLGTYPAAEFRLRS